MIVRLGHHVMNITRQALHDFTVRNTQLPRTACSRWEILTRDPESSIEELI